MIIRSMADKNFDKIEFMEFAIPTVCFECNIVNGGSTFKNGTTFRHV